MNPRTDSAMNTLTDQDGVFFSIQGPNMRVRLAFYRNVLDYILTVPFNMKKKFPKVSDTKAFCESLMIMKIWGDDQANGFEILLAPSEEWNKRDDETEEEYYKRKDKLLFTDKKKPGKDYIPQYFIKISRS